MYFVSGIQKAPHYAGQLLIAVDRFLSVSIKKSCMREIGKLIEYVRLVSVNMVSECDSIPPAIQKMHPAQIR